MTPRWRSDQPFVGMLDTLDENGLSHFESLLQLPEGSVLNGGAATVDYDVEIDPGIPAVARLIVPRTRST